MAAVSTVRGRTNLSASLDNLDVLQRGNAVLHLSMLSTTIVSTPVRLREAYLWDQYKQRS
jgi:hypothetical protein